MQQQARRRDGARAAAPLVPAVFAFGASFGVLARGAGIDAIAACVMSATTFAGAAQFAAVSILGSGGGLAAAVVAALLLNLRYAPISISVAHLFRGAPWRRSLESQLIVDESWAVSSRAGRYERELLVGAGIALWLAWTGGTAVGALAGEELGDPQRLGLDGAFPALFLALLVTQIRGRAPLSAALLGGGIALVLIPVAPPGVPIVAASAAALIGFWRGV